MFYGIVLEHKAANYKRLDVEKHGRSGTYRTPKIKFQHTVFELLIRFLFRKNTPLKENTVHTHQVPHARYGTVGTGR